MSSPLQVAVMNQAIEQEESSAIPVCQSPLAHAVAARQGTASGVSGADASVELEEQAVGGLLVLRAGSAAAALSVALNKELGLALPDRLQSTQTSTCCVRWMSPDEWLLSCPLNDCLSIEESLRAAVESGNGSGVQDTATGFVAIVNVSGGYSVLRLSGASAAQVLKKSTAYDIDPVNFPPGKVVNTTLAKTQVTMRALPDAAFELIVRRSFADYAWLWLQRAGAEYGLRSIVSGG